MSTPDETPAEDIRNAITLLDTAMILPVRNVVLGNGVWVEVRARLISALEKLENPATSPVGSGRGTVDATVDAHPGVPASLYMLSA